MRVVRWFTIVVLVCTGCAWPITVPGWKLAVVVERGYTAPRQVQYESYGCPYPPACPAQTRTRWVPESRWVRILRCDLKYGCHKFRLSLDSYTWNAYHVGDIWPLP